MLLLLLFISCVSFFQNARMYSPLSSFVFFCCCCCSTSIIKQLCVLHLSFVELLFLVLFLSVFFMLFILCSMGVCMSCFFFFFLFLVFVFVFKKHR